MGDSVRLQQVISSILENAVKHTENGDTIRVGLKTTAGEAVVTISDTDGIAPDVLPHISSRSDITGRLAAWGLG